MSCSDLLSVDACAQLVAQGGCNGELFQGASIPLDWCQLSCGTCSEATAPSPASSDATPSSELSPPDVLTSVPSPASHANTGLIVGVVILVLVLLTALGFLGYCLYKRRRRQEDSGTAGGGARQESEESILDGRFREFRWKEIKTMTNSFDDRRILGRGGFGVVYKGETKRGELCAVKCPEAKGLKAADFEKEVNALQGIEHENLIRLLGCCKEAGKQILVYEFAPRGSLERSLPQYRKTDAAGPPANSKGAMLMELDGDLTLQQRLKIALGAALGLKHLHSKQKKMIHRDIKPQNILLTESMEAKLADFGLLREVQNSQYVSLEGTMTRIVGTPGYVDPAYMQSGTVSEFSDVYSLCVVLLEVFTGRYVRITEQGDLQLAAAARARALEASPSAARSSNHPSPAHANANASTAESGEVSHRESGTFNTGASSAQATQDDASQMALHITKWAQRVLKGGSTLELWDPQLLQAEAQARGRPLGAEDHKTLTTCMEVVIRCTFHETSSRPTLDDVIRELQEAQRAWGGTGTGQATGDGELEGTVRGAVTPTVVRATDSLSERSGITGFTEGTWHSQVDIQ